MATMGRFILKFAHICLSFIKCLRYIEDFEWTEEVEQAFKWLKKHLEGILALINLAPRETQVIYLLATNTCISAVWMREKQNRQLLGHFVNHILSRPEVNYPNLKKLALAFVAYTVGVLAYHLM